MLSSPKPQAPVKDASHRLESLVRHDGWPAPTSEHAQSSTERRTHPDAPKRLPARIALSSASGLERQPSAWFGVAATACLVSIVCAGYAVWRSHATPPPDSQIAAINPPVITTVTALGRLSPQGDVLKLSAPLSNHGDRVKQLLVERGDRVKVGQVIAILDGRDQLQAAYEQAQAAVKVAQAKLAITQAGAKQGEIDAQRAEIDRLEAQQQGELAAQAATVARFKAELQYAEAEFDRYQALNQVGAIADAELDHRRLTLSTARNNLTEATAVLARIQATGPAQLDQARATLARLVDVRPVDRRAEQAAVEQAVAAMQQAKAELEQAYVRSPIEGEILDIYTRAGEVVGNDGIVTLGQTQRMYAIAQVYQSDIRKVKPGQAVQLTNDAMPDALLGTVERIDAQVKRQTVVNTDPNTNTDGRVVDVYVALDHASSQRAAKFTNLQVTVAIKL